MVKSLDLTSLASFDPAPANPKPSGESGSIEVAVTDVIPDPLQPRKKFDKASIERLAETIKASQLNQPVTVRPVNEDGKYIIVMGERRWRACTLAGLKTLPVIVSTKADSYDQVTENTEHEALTTMELARFIADKVQAGDKKSYIAKRLAMRPDAVSQHLALASAPEFIQKLGDETEIGGRTLYELVQAHKEFPSEVERFVEQGKDITRASVVRLIEQLRTREATERAQAEAAQAAAAAAAQTNTQDQDQDQDQDLEQNNAPQEETKPPAQPKEEESTTVQVPANANGEPSSTKPQPAISVLVNGRAASLASAGTVLIVYADTGEIAEVNVSEVQILAVGG